MNKAGIVDAVHAKISGTKKTAEDAVDAVFETITNALAKGEEVAISGFGNFLVKRRTARVGVNPRTGQKIQINESIPDDARASYKILGIKKTGETDTVRTLTLTNGTADLSDIDANTYPQIMLSGNINASSDKQSPTINKVSVDFTGTTNV